MQTMQVKTDELLNIIKSNRDKHQNDFNKTLEGYKIQMKATANAVAAAYNRNANILRDFDPNREKDMPHFPRLENMSLHLKEPQCYVSSYNNAIKMLEICATPEVELTMDDAEKYLSDNWSWKEDFSTCSGMYIK